MTKKDITYRLEKMIQQGEFKRFFDAINDFYLSDSLLEKLNDEWHGLQYMQEKKMIRDSQLSQVFFIVYKKYEHQILQEIDESSATKHFDDYEFSHTNRGNSTSNKPKEEYRPVIFTIFATIYSIGLLTSVFSIPVVIGRMDNLWYVLINALQLFVGVIHIISLWKMRKSSFSSYLINVLIGGVSLLLQNSTNPLIVLFPESIHSFLLTLWGLVVIVYGVIILYYYNDLD